MALLDDATTIALLVTSSFFVALAFGLLVRYRQLSQKIAGSSDLGHDLWDALEQRMRKQDERILDMMGRMEVVQSRVMSQPPPPEPMVQPSTPTAASQMSQPDVEPSDVEREPLAMQQPASQQKSQRSQLSQPEPAPESPQSLPTPEPLPEPGQSPESPPEAKLVLDQTQLATLRQLAEGTKNTRQLTDALKKSREHTARLMKDLFELGLVRRNVASKPFVYQITDEGRRKLESND
ncbi:MAG TPA: helix-turn-helix domain-containing protein [Nitrososphaerales archaeon]|nr:helix-turn-helix domain-containing protein [Nitrososphaerales archaeon]